MSCFQQYLQLREFEDVMNQSLDGINLVSSSTGSNYDFTIDGENYEVKFIPTKIYGSEGILAKNGINVHFRGPKSVYLTGKNKSTAVYRQVFLSIRKYIQQFNPDGLVYFGATAEQDWMYNKFYERYLKQAFTQISSEVYISNAYMEKARMENPELYKDIQYEIQSFDYKGHSERLQSQKLVGRKKSVLANKITKSIVKINSNYLYPVQVAYVREVLTDTDTVKVFFATQTYGAYFLQRTDIRLGNVKSFVSVDLANPEIKKQIEGLQQVLKSDYGIEANLYMG